MASARAQAATCAPQPRVLFGWPTTQRLGESGDGCACLAGQANGDGIVPADVGRIEVDLDDVRQGEPPAIGRVIVQARPDDQRCVGGTDEVRGRAVGDEGVHGSGAERVVARCTVAHDRRQDRSAEPLREGSELWRHPRADCATPGDHERPSGGPQDSGRAFDVALIGRGIRRCRLELRTARHGALEQVGRQFDVRGSRCAGRHRPERPGDVEGE